MNIFTKVLIIFLMNSHLHGKAIGTSVSDLNTPDRILFPPFLNGVEQPKISFNYKVTDSTIDFSDHQISQNTLFFYLGNLGALSPEIFKNADFQQEQIYFLLTIPKAFMQKGLINFLDEGGNLFYSFDLEKNPEAIKIGESLRKILQEKNLITQSNEEPLTIVASLVEMNMISRVLESKNTLFKVCFENQSQKWFQKICTPSYKYYPKQSMSKVQSKIYGDRVLINDETVGTSGESVVFEDKEVHFFAANKSGYIFEFAVKPQPILLTDFYSFSSSADENKSTSSGGNFTPRFHLIGHTNIPIGKNIRLFNFEDEATWRFKLGWLPTIGDFKRYWRGEFDLKEPLIYVQGNFGGLFIHRFKIDRIPDYSLKPKVDESTSRHTYSSVVKIRGAIKPGYDVSSSSKSARLLDGKKGTFVWNFSANKMDQENTQSLLLKNKTEGWVVQYSVDRIHNMEVSFRLAGVASNDLKFNVLAEGALNYWFEDLGGWQNPLWSKQRWGVSVNAFKPLKSFETYTSTDKFDLSLFNLNLKYRFTSGIWERDETWGAILGYENIQFSNIQARLLGGGIFWARSMPKVFDDLMNYLPLMKFPKWVDCDVVYYSLPLDKEIHPKTNLAVNFHGKVMWSKKIFGEAGFGYKVYSFQDKVKKKQPEFNFFYGTVGIGVNF